MRTLEKMLSEARKLFDELMETRDYTVFWNSENGDYFEKILYECEQCYKCKLKKCGQRKKHYGVTKKAIWLARLANNDQVTADEWLRRVEELVDAAGWDLDTFEDCPDSDRREAENDEKFFAMLF